MTERVILKKTIWDAQTDERLRQMWDDNLTMRQIGNAIGCSRCAVAGRVRRLGLPGRRAIGNRLNEHVPDIVTRFTEHRKEKVKMQPQEPLAEPTSETNVTLLESRSFHCRWIVEVEGAEEPMICGARASNGPYCPAHHAKSRQPSQPRRDNDRQLNWRSRI